MEEFSFHLNNVKKLWYELRNIRNLIRLEQDNIPVTLIIDANETKLMIDVESKSSKRTVTVLLNSHISDLQMSRTSPYIIKLTLDDFISALDPIDKSYRLYLPKNGNRIHFESI